MLNLKNDTSLESVLVKVELLRLRLAQNFHSNNGPMSAQFRLFSSTSRSGKFKIQKSAKFKKFSFLVFYIFFRRLLRIFISFY